jgi:hypothetical protein
MADDDLKRRVPFLFLEDLRARFLATYGDRGKTAIAFAMNDEFQHVVRTQMVSSIISIIPIFFFFFFFCISCDKSV